MAFSMSGTYRDRDVSLTWDDGHLSGDGAAVFALRAQAGLLDGTFVGPPGGPFTERDHLKSPISTLMLCRDLLDDLEVSGDVPTLPAIPDGAVA